MRQAMLLKDCANSKVQSRGKIRSMEQRVQDPSRERKYSRNSSIQRLSIQSMRQSRTSCATECYQLSVWRTSKTNSLKKAPKLLISHNIQLQTFKTKNKYQNKLPKTKLSKTKIVLLTNFWKSNFHLKSVTVKSV